MQTLKIILIFFLLNNYCFAYLTNSNLNVQGGHIDAAQNGGAGEQINYFPQDALLNNGGYKSLENTWAKATVEGKKVNVKINPVYEGTSKRPSKFDIAYTINGEEPITVKFLNTPTGGN